MSNCRVQTFIKRQMRCFVKKFCFVIKIAPIHNLIYINIQAICAANIRLLKRKSKKTVEYF